MSSSSQSVQQNRYPTVHESDVEHARSFSVDDLEVPEPVAETMGVDDLAAFDGFEHRGITVEITDVVKSARHALYNEHVAQGEEAAPQTSITLHDAADRLASFLGSRFDTWMTTQPEIALETSSEALDESDVWGYLWGDDPLGLRDGGINYHADIHRDLIVSALAVVFSHAVPQEEADMDVRREDAQRELKMVVAGEAHGALSREEVHEVVDQMYDQMDDRFGALED
ncbi:hypothetical protein D8Y22_05465 [Salinadaptatus halalkaliphilus]|uniref:Uncharacterized protein n=1 Tax=Salinadaptatus halalkaliphilus TaxID=2419781 RepID=A0A4S3TR64_9EURY|nr:hypothetical protein [Salinadaptatus halalkaliphilus]THE65833.1 hypothetical protein D8Y22_05465 [Salinadaptatus halalkaliphilus]